jgi:hypothetical protein
LAPAADSHSAQPNVKHNTGLFSPASVLKLITRKTLSVSGKGVTMYRFSVQGQHLVCLAEDGITDAAGRRDPPSNVVTKCNVWVPLPIVRHALPSFVKRGDEGVVLVVCILCFLVHSFSLISFFRHAPLPPQVQRSLILPMLMLTLSSLTFLASPTLDQKWFRGCDSEVEIVTDH